MTRNESKLVWTDVEPGANNKTNANLGYIWNRFVMLYKHTFCYYTKRIYADRFVANNYIPLYTEFNFRERRQIRGN